MKHNIRLTNLTFLIFILSTGFIVSCRDSEALAEFEGGKVTRKELRTVLVSFRGESFIKQASTQIQEQILKNLALSRIAAMEAKKNNLDKGPDHEKRMSFFKEETMVPAYVNYLKDKFKEEPFEMINMQVFKLNGPGRKQEADMLLNELNDKSKSDSEIESIIYNKNENLRYKLTGGYVDPLCISCSMNNAKHLTDPLEKAEMKKFIAVEDQGGYWILRKVSQKKVKQENLKYEFEKYFRKVADFQKSKIDSLDEKSPERAEIEKVLMTKETIVTQSEQAAEAQIQRESNSPIIKYIEELKVKKNFTVYPPQHQEFEKGLPDTYILYSYKETHYTYGDLKKRLDGIYGDDTRMHMQVLNGSIIPYELLKDEKDFQDVVNDSFYKFIAEMQTNNILSSSYIKMKVEVKDVSPEEIQQWYELRKLTEYKGKPLFAVKEQIRQNLINVKQQENMQKLQDELSKQYKLKINTDKLTAGKI